jgi:uncharacterized repeat protein (TIGR03803 family)
MNKTTLRLKNLSKNRVFLSFIVLIISIASNAQIKLVGMYEAGGKYGKGAIYACLVSPSPYTVSASDTLYSFSGPDGSYPYGSLIQAPDGNLYGMTAGGGTYGHGTIFRFTTSGVLTTLYSFDSIAGYDPWGSLIQGIDGNFYGMTYAGGQHGKGVVFKYTTSGVYATLASFDSVHGANPWTDLVQSSSGSLYGMTYKGGTNGKGVIFKCTASGTLTTLVNFNEVPNANGGQPFGSVAIGTDGYLYGNTSVGGYYGYGTIIRCDTNGNNSTVFSFDQTDGQGPMGKLLQIGNNFYGLTSGGGNCYDGLIYEYYPGVNNVSVAHSFCVSNYPGAFGGLVLASNGKLYGNAEGVFSYDTTTGNPNPFTGLNYTKKINNNCSLIEVMNGYLSVVHSCSGQTIVDSVTDGIAPFTYLWSTGATTSSISGITNTAMYSVTVTDSRGFIAIDSIAPNGMLRLDSIVAKPATCYGGKGTITPYVKGGAVQYSYLWSNGYSYSILNAPIGSYTVTIKDAVGCIITDSATITQPATPLIMKLTAQDTICKGFADTLHAGGGTSYSWNTGATTSFITVSPAVTTTYTVYITSGTCTKDTTVTIHVNPTPTVAVAGNSAMCLGGIDTLRASGGVSYVWTDGATTSSITVSPAVTTTYTVYITTGACVRDTSVTVNVYPLPMVTVTGDSAICLGSSTRLTLGGAVTYTWLPSSGVNPFTGSVFTVSPGATTTYIIIGANAFGCVDSTTTTITVNPTNGFDLTGALYVCIDTPAYSNASIQACIYNSRCLPVSGTIKLVIDTAIHINNTIADTAAIMSGDTLIWHFDSLSDIGKTHCVTLSGYIDSLPAGDSVFVSMFITPTVGDSVPTNNSFTYWVKPFAGNCVGYPYDPNEKSVYPMGNIVADQQLSYTIHFQNTGTAPARNVVVIDTLSPYLDPTTLKLRSSSSPVVTTITGGNIARFEFNNINLPDTATSKTSSIGVFGYTISPMATVVPGNVINNTAGIYFDHNSVVLTNTTVNTIIEGAQSVQNISPALNMACFPNPFSTSTNLVFNTNGAHYLELDDVTGRKLETITCTGRQYTLNRNGLAVGLYFIKVLDPQMNNVAAIKVVVQ